MALERELATWQRLGGFQHREEALRLRATLQRTQRLAESYCQLLLDTLSVPAATLGTALGVDAERSAVFAESEIRANVVFQLSKLTLLLQRATTQVAQTTPWDVVMAGNASGVLLEAPTLDLGCLENAQGQDAIVLVGSATGDEELGSLGSLKGVILRHMLPHLSHLGVRARQEKVPFVACDDDAEIENSLRQLIGKKIVMKSEVDGVTFELAGEHNTVSDSTSSSSSAASNGNGASSDTTIAVVKKVDKVSFIPLEAATVETCGAKAAVCGELLHLANECVAALQTRGRGDGAPLFEAPNGVVLPFGCLEAALEANKKDKEFADLLAKADSVAKKLTSSSTASTTSTAAADLDGLTAELASIIASLRLPQTILLTLGGAFDPGSTIIVRSSANVEDLAGMSGAGLYESIPNINPRDPEAVQSAIHSVWASLHTRRALLARAAAGVDASVADMAVLCQQQLAPELSFVLHTTHPITRDAASLVAEVAPGLGETLASGTRGSAWRLQVERDTGNVKTLAFANFSSALLPTSAKGFSSVFSPTIDSTNDAGLANTGSSLPGSGSGSVGSLSDLEDDDYEEEDGGKSLSVAAAALAAASSTTTVDTVVPCVVDYSQQELSWSEDVRSALGKRLAAVGRLLESEFEGAQDVEGCVVDGRLFVVQTRPQP
jgi:phosphoglucan,water dikinase